MEEGSYLVGHVLKSAFRKKSMAWIWGVISLPLLASPLILVYGFSITYLHVQVEVAGIEDAKIEFNAGSP
eukprot:751621-Hanusia_phi.AAC.1